MILGTTSFVGISFVAYLTEKQVAQFSKDARVSRLTQDVYLTPSALWNSSTDGSGQVRSWGLSAMGLTGGVPSNGSATVYVLDTGVDVNADLNVTSRTAAFTGLTP